MIDLVIIYEKEIYTHVLGVCDSKDEIILRVGKCNTI